MVWLGLDLVVLLAVALAMLAPGLDAPVIPGTEEARILSQTVRMIAAGDWIGAIVDPAAGPGSPVLLHWLQALAAAASGQGAEAEAWILRLPSLAGALATVLFTYAIARSLGSRRAALVAGLLAASTVALAISARTASADALLTALVVAAMWAIASLWSEEEPRRRIGRNAVFWVAVGLGMLLRAPIMLMVVASALAVLAGADVVNGRRTSRGAQLGVARLAALDPLKGLVIQLLVLGPIAALTAVLAEGMPTALVASVVAMRPGLGLPPGTHAIVAIGTFWPMIAFLPLAIARAVGRDADPMVRQASTVLVAWVLPAWLVLEALPRKSPMDVLPLLPAVAVFAGLAVGAGRFTVARWSVRSGFLLIAAGAVVLSFGLNAAHVVANERADAMGLLVGLAAIIAGLAAARLLRRGRAVFGVIATVVTAMLLSILAFAVLTEARRILPPQSDEVGAEAAPSEVEPVAPQSGPAEPAPAPPPDMDAPPPARTDGFF